MTKLPARLLFSRDGIEIYADFDAYANNVWSIAETDLSLAN
jgi:hypothetical protein